MELLLFIPTAALALAGALTVISARRAIHSALALLVVLASLAVLYLLLGAQFIAVLQVIIYAGAIVVLFLFVIMLLHMATGEPGSAGPPGRRAAALGLAALFLIGLLSAVARPVTAPPAVTTLQPDFGTAELVGRQLFTRFLLPFELASVILLAGIIGAVVLAKGTLPVTAHPAAPEEAE
ncbi:MAG: NADH-quinone oxidoreductase subunit J family protein [Gemmatimonadales bacterium]